MENLISGLVGTLVGALIAGAISWLLLIRGENKSLKERRTFFSTAISDDLNEAIKLYINLKTDWSKMYLVNFEYIIELKERRKIYQRNIEALLLFPRVFTELCQSQNYNSILSLPSK